MKMSDIELEEGEAYFTESDHDDGDENFDPDKDFSYIDEKIEYLLGHYQKDFMGDLSPRRLGARFGGYGSFLPMHQRTPPIVSNQQIQSYKSQRNSPSEDPPPQYVYLSPAVAAKISLPPGHVPVPDQSGRSLKVSSLTGAGVPPITDQSKLENSREGISNQQKQTQKPMTRHSDAEMLKFKVKMAPAGVLSRDNSAIYSGLGLDLSPCSSSEGSPSENGEASPCLLEMEAESPSFMLETMTSFTLPNEALLSPLDDGFLSLMEVEDILETGLTGSGQVQPLDLVNDINCLEGQKEACKESYEKLNAIKEKKPKQEYSNKESLVKRSVQMQKPVEYVKDSYDFLAKSKDLTASKKQKVGTPVVRESVSSTINSVNAKSRETDKSSYSRMPALFDKKSDSGCVVEDLDIHRKQVQMARRKGKIDFHSTSSNGVVEDEGLGNESKGNVEKDRAAVLTHKVQPMADKRKELGLGDDKVNKVSKPPSVMKNKSKEEVIVSVCFKEAAVDKEFGMRDKTPNDKEKSSVSFKFVQNNDKHCGISQKALSHVQMGLSMKEPSPPLMKKNLKDSHANGVHTEPPRGSLGIRSSEKYIEEVISGNKCKKVDIDSHSKLKKDSEGENNENSSKKGNEVSSRNFEVGVSERESQQYASKVKEQPRSKKSGFPNVGPNFTGDLAGGNCLGDKSAVSQLAPTSSAIPLEMDNWVGCEKCNKWRLLPFGVNPESLPKKWVCSMITWLPGKNKCSVSEDETTNALRACYLPPVLAPALQVNNQLAHPDRSGFVNVLSAPKGFPNAVTHTDVLANRGKVKNFAKSDIDISVQSGAHDVHIPIMRDQSDSGGIRSSKILKSFPEEADSVTKNGDGRPLEVSNKRMAEYDLSGVPKKVKKSHRQLVKDSDPVGQLPLETKAENQNPDASLSLQDFVQGTSEYSHVKVKGGGMVGRTAKVNDIKGFSEKRKSRDRRESAISAEDSFDNCQQPLNNPVAVKDRKSDTSNFAARNRSGDTACQKTHGFDCKQNSGQASDSCKHKGARISDMSLEQCQVYRTSEKTPDARKTTEKNPHLGFSDNTTISSSLKVSSKVKPKARQVNCSPVGSISLSPLKVYKSDTGKGMNNVGSRYELEETSSRMCLKSCADITCVPHDFSLPNEDLKDRKSHLSKTSGVLSVAADENHFPSASSGKKPNTDRINAQPIQEGHKHSASKLDLRYHEEINTLEEKLGNHALNGLHIDKTKSRRDKLTAPEKVREKGSLSLRNPNNIGYEPKDVEASSSTKEDGLPLDAKDVLREATILKLSANRLKTTGSGQSTGIFFQAALKFLHGASLLELSSNESGRMGEKTSTDVYKSTAKLFEYCAREYEKCKDLAAAALAYKCMEFGYMRVIYYNDAAVSRDQAELQMAVRTTPQVESPSSSASDIDNLNNHANVDAARDGHSAVDNRNHVIPAGNKPNFLRLLNFTQDVNLAMRASKRSQSAFAAASLILSQAGKEESISSIKRVLDFSFHDVEDLLHLVRRALEALEKGI